MCYIELVIFRQILSVTATSRSNSKAIINRTITPKIGSDCRTPFDLFSSKMIDRTCEDFSLCSVHRAKAHNPRSTSVQANPFANVDEKEDIEAYQKQVEDRKLQEQGKFYFPQCKKKKIPSFMIMDPAFHRLFFLFLSIYTCFLLIPIISWLFVSHAKTSSSGRDNRQSETW